MRRAKILINLTLITLILIMVFQPALAMTAAGPAENHGAHIILIADISSSMNTVDKERYLPEALKLAVDLVPAGSRVSLFTVNDQLVFASDWTDVSTPAGRQILKTNINDITYHGQTNLAPAMARALAMLHELRDETQPRKIILITDISEGGFYLGQATTAAYYEAQGALLRDMAQEAQDSSIIIDAILLKQAPSSDTTVASVENLALQTGGELIRLDDTSALPQSIENIYFNTFTYSGALTTLVNTLAEEQKINIVLPTEHINRVRVYFSAVTPVKGIQASYAGTVQEAEINRSYAMIDLARPAREGLQVSIAPGGADAVRIYQLTDYTLELQASSAYAAGQDQKTNSDAPNIRLTADLIDTVSGQSILEPGLLEKYTCFLYLTAPDGETMELEAYPDPEGKLTAYFSPTVFGQYDISASLKQGDFLMGSPVAKVAVEKEQTWLFTAKVAASLGGCLIIAAAVFAWRRKYSPLAAGEPRHDYGFSGKLDVYVVWAQAGEYEIPPFAFYLNRISGRKEVNLAEVLAAGDSRTVLSAAKEIWFYVGPEKDLLVRNDSSAQINFAGNVMPTKENIRLSFGQKFYITFQEGVDEIEIYYRNAKANDKGQMTNDK